MRTRTVLAAIGAVAAAGAGLMAAPTAFAAESPNASTAATLDRDPPRDDPTAWHTSRRIANLAQCNSLRELIISRGFEVKPEGCYKDENWDDDGADAPPVPHTWIWRFQYRAPQK